MATTVRVRSHLVRRANGNWDPDSTVEVTTDDPQFDLRAALRRLHREVHEEEQAEIRRRTQEDRLVRKLMSA